MRWPLAVWDRRHFSQRQAGNTGARINQDVVIDIDLPLDLCQGEFQPDSVMAMMAVGMRIVENVYDDLMELCTRGHKPRPQE